MSVVEFDLTRKRSDLLEVDLIRALPVSSCPRDKLVELHLTGEWISDPRFLVAGTDPSNLAQDDGD